jgi:hypothetical protein
LRRRVERRFVDLGAAGRFADLRAAGRVGDLRAASRFSLGWREERTRAGIGRDGGGVTSMGSGDLLPKLPKAFIELTAMDMTPSAIEALSFG